MTWEPFFIAMIAGVGVARIDTVDGTHAFSYYAECHAFARDSEPSMRTILREQFPDTDITVLGDCMRHDDDSD